MALRNLIDDNKFTRDEILKTDIIGKILHLMNLKDLSKAMLILCLETLNSLTKLDPSPHFAQVFFLNQII